MPILQIRRLRPRSQNVAKITQSVNRAMIQPEIIRVQLRLPLYDPVQVFRAASGHDVTQKLQLLRSVFSSSHWRAYTSRLLFTS